MTKPMKYKALTTRLKAAGFKRARQGKGDHEVWSHPQRSRPVVITHTTEVSPGVTRNALRAIEDGQNN